MTARKSIEYVGRFAPSPTGPLHFGSLVAAVASYLQARANSGRWLLRIEDIDPPREQPGASADILRTLEVYGFEWDGSVVFQSGSQAAHEDAIQYLLERQQCYRCSCSRKDLAGVKQGPLGSIYPGTCRNGTHSADGSIRVRTNNTPIEFHDHLQGHISQQLESESGDFVIKRRDGLIAYHLAVVVDDALQNVTEVVRGIDLMDSTPRQIWLQQLLGLPTPDYAHVPVIVDAQGDKLSKLTHAAPIPDQSPGAILLEALEALNQSPPTSLAGENIGSIWSWATENWQLGKLNGIRAIEKTS